VSKVRIEKFSFFGYNQVSRNWELNSKEGVTMLAHLTAIYEKGEKYYIGYCPEVLGANGQGETMEECRESLKEAIKLILQDRLEDALRGVPDDAIRG
jgi:predicted RNase H-like HicB family nuclease